MPEPLVDRIVRSQRWLDPLGDASQGAIGCVFKLLGSPGHAGSKPAAWMFPASRPVQSQS